MNRRSLLKNITDGAATSLKDQFQSLHSDVTRVATEFKEASRRNVLVKKSTKNLSKEANNKQPAEPKPESDGLADEIDIMLARMDMDRRRSRRLAEALKKSNRDL